MTHPELIAKFYKCFAAHDPEGMVCCYHSEIEFYDPAFGLLKGDQVNNMWRMLIARSRGELMISFSNIKADSMNGSAEWKAEYFFSKTRRRIINVVSASFEFRDGKIIKHIDHFNMYKWTQQALGWKGYLLGWTSFMQNKIKQQANGLLKEYSPKS